MISLRLWLLSLLVVLPFYTYSLNQPAGQVPEDVFAKRDMEDSKADAEKRQLDPDFLASLSSALQSVSDFLDSFSLDLGSFTTIGTDFDADLSSILQSISSEFTATNSRSFTTTSENSPIPTETTPVSGTPGQVVPEGTRTGTVGDDGRTRYCSASSFLCPSSLSFGCCRDQWTCGSTACTPPGAVNTGLPTANIASFTGDSPQGTATFPFEKGNAAETGAAVAAGGSKGLSGGAIGGIVGGVVALIASIAGGITWYYLSKPKAGITVPPVDVIPPDGPKGPEYPSQPPMAQYGQNPDPRFNSPPPPTGTPGEFYQPYPPGQYPQPTGYSQYGPAVSELGGAAMPHGQKVGEIPAPPPGVQEAPATSVNPQPPQPPAQGGQPGQTDYSGYKGPSGPVYELS